MAQDYSYNGFEYKEIPSKEGLTCNIIHEIPKPESIYKYYPLNDYSIEALLKGYLYSAHPYEINDYLDSSVFLIGSRQRIDYAYYKKLLGHVFESEKELKEFYEQDNVEGYYSHGYILNFWKMISNIFGIISMSGTDKNELMWPHYTKEKGFQLKFSTNKLEESIRNNIGKGQCHGLFPINYTKRLNPIDFSDFVNPTIPFFYSTNIKSDKWEYENEWRFLISKENMGVPNSKSGLEIAEDWKGNIGSRYAFYDKNLIKEITLGHNFFTGEEFIMNRKNNTTFTVEPICNKKDSNYQNHFDLLDYIEKNLSDKIFYSGRKYEFDDNNFPYLIRTKERMEIDRLDVSKYKLTRTNEFY